jgi:hypothetical protein
MTVEVARYPITPTTEKVKGTLLDAANVGDEWEWLSGDDLFESYNCLTFGAAADFCAPNSKTFPQSPQWVDGAMFAAYGGLACRMLGLDLDKAQREVARVFDGGEARAVERGLMEKRFRADTGGSPRWGAPTDLTPAGGAVSPAVGIALLESYAASNYVGVPTLHMPRAIASLRGQVSALEWDGNLLRTFLGSKVAAGGGYDLVNYGPDGTAAPAGEKWIYGTGEVVIARSKAEIRSAIAAEQNDGFVLAERGYIVAVDCFAAAVRVTVTG